VQTDVYDIHHQLQSTQALPSLTCRKSASHKLMLHKKTNAQALPSFIGRKSSSHKLVLHRTIDVAGIEQEALGVQQ